MQVIIELSAEMNKIETRTIQRISETKRFCLFVCFRKSIDRKTSLHLINDTESISSLTKSDTRQGHSNRQQKSQKFIKHTLRNCTPQKWKDLKK